MPKASKLKVGQLVCLSPAAFEEFRDPTKGLTAKVVEIALRDGSNPLIHMSNSLGLSYSLDEHWVELATPKIDLTAVYS